MPIQLTCQECGKEYQKPPSREKESRFCSRSCQGKYQSRIKGLGTKIRPDTPWNKGKTAAEDERIATQTLKAGQTYQEKVVSGEIVPYWTGKRLTDEHRQKIRLNCPDRSGKKNSMYGRRGKDAPNYGGHLRGGQGYRSDLGHNVRSRWEANFARILRVVGRNYHWDGKTFDLNGEGTYTPDFWDCKRKCWWEIKSVWTDRARYKVERFRFYYPDEELRIVDKRFYERLKRAFSHKIAWETDKRGR